MYVIINNHKYLCLWSADNEGVFTFLSEYPLSAVGELKLYDDEDVLVKIVDTSDYSFKALTPGELVLSNDIYYLESPPEPMTMNELILDKLTELEYRQDLIALGLMEGGAII